VDTLEIRHLIGATWLGDPVRERINPARPDDVVTLSAVGDAETVDRALRAADEARHDWGATPPPQRGEILRRAADILEKRLDEVATDLTREEGKTLSESTGEVRRAVAVLRFFGGEGWRIGGNTYPPDSGNGLIYTRREPVGIVAAITPWNFPIAIPAWKIAPALVAGNAVVLKPAQITPGSAWHLTRSLVEAGLPAGVLSLVNGSGSVVGSALVDDPRVAAVSFTGSVSIGKAIYQHLAPRLARAQLEMGGKNALIVLDDAVPTIAARIAAAGGFGLTGQACTATSRVICTPGVKSAFLEAFVEEARRYRPGDGLQDGVLMGPVISEEQASSNRSYVNLARAAGSTSITGGDDGQGLFQSPVIVTGVDVDDRVAQEEVFGPVVAIIDAADLDEAIAIANATPYGLSAGVVTNDLEAAQRFAREVQAGVVKINESTSGVALNVPFGGVKDSSTNTYREQGSAALDFFTWSKSIYLTPPSS
jgi:acyl-CoA reductase-like NAD-dependent aldehyde dehydrogenase